jgi:hypothetical protein
MFIVTAYDTIQNEYVYREFNNRQSANDFADNHYYNNDKYLNVSIEYMS